MNMNSFDMSEFVAKESNIWACIYRGINRKKDNNEFDEEEEEEQSPLMNLRSMNNNDLLSFKDQLISQPKSANLQYIQEEDDSSGFEEENDFEREIEDLEDECEPRPDPSLKKTVSNAVKPKEKTVSSSIPNLKMGKKQMSVFGERKQTHSGFARLNTEYSELRSGTLTKSLTTSLKHTSSNLREEEYLVLYYISIVIRL